MIVHLLAGIRHAAVDAACGLPMIRTHKRGALVEDGVSAWQSDVTCPQCLARDRSLQRVADGATVTA